MGYDLTSNIRHFNTYLYEKCITPGSLLTFLLITISNTEAHKSSSRAV